MCDDSSKHKGKGLSKLFFEACGIQLKTENTSDPVNSDVIQNLIKSGLRLLELVLERIEQLKLFSMNEESCEVTTGSLKYLIAPAIYGELMLLLQTSRVDRLKTILSAETYLKQFLLRCRDYNLGCVKELDFALDNNYSSGMQSHSVVDMSSKRKLKIDKFKREKEVEERIRDFREKVGRDDDDNYEGVDDEIVRKYWFAVVEKWISKSIASIESIQQEKEILTHLENLHNESSHEKQHPLSSTAAPKNFILARDEVQAAVFGAGYPSLPTMTVEQWYQKHADSNSLPDHGFQGNAPRVNDEVSDSEEDHKLQKQRALDDFKDTHRRGDGNRMNMG